MFLQPGISRTKSSEPHVYQVVVIEPRNEVGFVLKKLLECDGHEVHHIRSGLEGIELTIALSPDIVISAITIPDRDGFGVARELAKRCPKKPLLIALTSYLKLEIGEQLRDAGFDLFLAKPVSREALLAAVNVKAGMAPSEEMQL